VEPALATWTLDPPTVCHTLAGPGEAAGEFLATPAARIEPGPAPTFSVIVAAYNVADVIGDALKSIQAQTIAPLEVIVCDDGSTDDLEGAVELYRDAIVLLRQENGGEAAAKNTAAAAATGDFVAILDADDVYFPKRLDALNTLAQARPDLDILTTDGYLCVGDRIVRRNYDRSWRFEIADQRRAIIGATSASGWPQSAVNGSCNTAASTKRSAGRPIGTSGSG
jgi:glycosyltransferase involved in cell wall biosynthesis